MKKSQLNWNLYHALLIAAIILSSFSVIGSTATFAQDAPPPAWQVRTMEADQTGINQPIGLVFSSHLNAFYVLDAKDWKRSSATTDLIELSPTEKRGASARIAAAIQDPINMAFDNQSNRLLILHAQGNQLLEVLADQNGILDPATLTRHNVVYFGLQNPQGLTVDPVSGDLFILDAAGPRIVRVSGGLDSGTVSVVDLASSGISTPRGIAFDPSTGYLHVVSQSGQRLYELSQSGEILASHDLSQFNMKDIEGIVFAPSGDQTDDPAQMSVYLADTGLAGSSAAPSQTNATPVPNTQSTGQIMELSLLAPAALPPGITLLPTTVVHVIDTSRAAWSPSAPDTAGVDYWPPPINRLLISDSEVDEMPNYFMGKNVYLSTTGGNLTSTCSTMAFTSEPTGLAINPNNNHVFFSTDANDRIFEVTLGLDVANNCTSVNLISTLNVSTLYNITDAEDVAYGNNTIFIGGGADAEVYIIPLGQDGVLGGGNDGPMTHFDTNVLGFSNVEGIGYNGDSGTLLIVSAVNTNRYLGETTTTGTLLRAYNLPYTGLTHREDVTYAPSSQNPALKNMYISDRGVDNNNDPNENDGEVWEISISGNPASTPTPTNTPGPSPTPTNTPPVTDSILADSFEDNTCLPWSSCVTDGSDLSFNSPALVAPGSQSLNALIDDNTSIYVTDDTPNAEPRYRARFYFDPNSISMVSGDTHNIFFGYAGTSTAVLRGAFRFSSGAYQVRFNLINDSGTWLNTSWFTITDASHAIEFDWRAATSAGANDGGLTVWIDGVQKANLTGVDNDTRRIDRVRLGAASGVDTGTRGTYYFDAFESRRQSFIGP